MLALRSAALLLASSALADPGTPRIGAAPETPVTPPALVETVTGPCTGTGAGTCSINVILLIVYAIYFCFSSKSFITG